MLLKWQPFLFPNYVHSLSLYYYTFLITAVLSEVYSVLKQHSFKLFFQSASISNRTKNQLQHQCVQLQARSAQLQTVCSASVAKARQGSDERHDVGG